MKISLIVAVNRNGVIGKDGKMPWHLPADLKYFKSVTMGKPIVMGRKTFESLGRPLPGRENIVLTRDKNFTAEGCTIIHSLEEMRQHTADVDEVMIIGGAQLYEQMLPHADHIYMTRVDCLDEGDTWFPAFNPAEWETGFIEAHEADEKNPCAYTFIRYDRQQ